MRKYKVDKRKNRGGGSEGGKQKKIMMTDTGATTLVPVDNQLLMPIQRLQRIFLFVGVSYNLKMSRYMRLVVPDLGKMKMNCWALKSYWNLSNLTF